MSMILRCAFVLIALCAQQTLAQPVSGCPEGQAMQSSDPSGRRVTCIQVTEADIIGQWAMTGTTNCLQATRGFDPQNFSPLISTLTNAVSQLAGTFIGTRTFYVGGTGHTVGTTHSTTFPATNYTTTSSSPGFQGGASVATLDANFTWSIQPDGTILIDDDNSIGQPITAPASLLGQTVTIENVPSFLGYISKDKRTIEMTHVTMAVETSVRRNASGVEQSRTPRFCTRARVLTRLP